MARTPSNMLPLGTKLPAFTLVDAKTNRPVAASDLGGKPLVVAFICNHCPFVQHIRSELAEFGRYCESQGVGMVAINSNDVVAYPQDGPGPMADDAKQFGYVFPYLFDEAQSVAKEFRAACTPDFYLFDSGGALAYRGQFDDSRPGNGVPVTGRDLRAAVDALIAGKAPNPDQKPSIGCNIKWRGGVTPT
jgi:peroxiredoxin